MGDWKYLRGYPPGSHQLFNLKTDIKELRDVSHANGAIFSELTSRWKAWCMTLPRSHSGVSPAGRRLASRVSPRHPLHLSYP